MSERYQRATDILELEGLLHGTSIGLTMNNIADYFGVSRRTAERMVGVLRQRFGGVESDTRDGRKYWSLENTYGEGPRGVLADLVESRRFSDRDIRMAAESKSDYQQVDETMAENPAVGTFVLDADFKVRWISRAMERFIGVDRDGVIGRDLRKLIRMGIGERLENHIHYSKKIFESYESNTFIEHLRCHVLPAEGREERWLDYWSQPINSGPYRGGRVEHYIDVTERVHGESARMRELRGWRGRFREEGETLMPEGIATALAYSIIQPLTDILAIAHDPDNVSGESARLDALEEISGQATRISESLDKMLGLTQSGHPVFESVKARSVVAAAISVVIPSATQAKVDVDLEVASNLEHFEFWADPNLLSYALDELLKNAVESMPDGGVLTLGASLSEDAQLVQFCVSDTGPGIRENLREKVLKPFFTTRHNANGLGLGIASSIAQLHRGKISLDAASSGGAIFRLTIPIDPR